MKSGTRIISRNSVRIVTITKKLTTDKIFAYTQIIKYRKFLNHEI
jgi:hypothetical protein